MEDFNSEIKKLEYELLKVKKSKTAYDKKVIYVNKKKARIEENQANSKATFDLSQKYSKIKTEYVPKKVFLPKLTPFGFILKTNIGLPILVDDSESRTSTPVYKEIWKRIVLTFQDKIHFSKINNTKNILFDDYVKQTEKRIIELKKAQKNLESGEIVNDTSYAELIHQQHVYDIEKKVIKKPVSQYVPKLSEKEKIPYVSTSLMELCHLEAKMGELVFNKYLISSSYKTVPTYKELDDKARIIRRAINNITVRPDEEARKATKEAMIDYRERNIYQKNKY